MIAPHSRPPHRLHRSPLVSLGEDIRRTYLPMVPTMRLPRKDKHHRYPTHTMNLSRDTYIYSKLL